MEEYQVIVMEMAEDGVYRISNTRQQETPLVTRTRACLLKLKHELLYPRGLSNAWEISLENLKLGVFDWLLCICNSSAALMARFHKDDHKVGFCLEEVLHNTIKNEKTHIVFLTPQKIANEDPRDHKRTKFLRSVRQVSNNYKGNVNLVVHDGHYISDDLLSIKSIHMGWKENYRQDSERPPCNIKVIYEGDVVLDYDDETIPSMDLAGLRSFRLRKRLENLPEQCVLARNEAFQVVSQKQQITRFLIDPNQRQLHPVHDFFVIVNIHSIRDYVIARFTPQFVQSPDFDDALSALKTECDPSFQFATITCIVPLKETLVPSHRVYSQSAISCGFRKLAGSYSPIHFFYYPLGEKEQACICTEWIAESGKYNIHVYFRGTWQDIRSLPLPTMVIQSLRPMTITPGELIDLAEPLPLVEEITTDTCRRFSFMNSSFVFHLKVYVKNPDIVVLITGQTEGMLLRISDSFIKDDKLGQLGQTMFEIHHQLRHLSRDQTFNTFAIFPFDVKTNKPLSDYTHFKQLLDEACKAYNEVPYATWMAYFNVDEDLFFTRFPNGSEELYQGNKLDTLHMLDYSVVPSRPLSELTVTCNLRHCIFVNRFGITLALQMQDCENDDIFCVMHDKYIILCRIPVDFEDHHVDQSFLQMAAFLRQTFREFGNSGSVVCRGAKLVILSVEPHWHPSTRVLNMQRMRTRSRIHKLRKYFVFTEGTYQTDPIRKSRKISIQWPAFQNNYMYVKNEQHLSPQLQYETVTRFEVAP